MTRFRPTELLFGRSCSALSAPVPVGRFCAGRKPLTDSSGCDFRPIHGVPGHPLTPAPYLVALR